MADNENTFAQLKLELGMEIETDAVKVLKAGLSEIKKIEDDIRIIQENKVEGMDKELDALEQRKKQLEEIYHIDEKIEALQEKDVSKKDFVKGLFGIPQEKAELSSYNVGSIMKEGITSAFDKATSKFKEGLKSVLDLEWNSLKDVLDDSLDKLDELVNTSFLTSSKTRANAFAYGMSASQSYGFEIAKQFLGISSEEDLMYMNSFQSRKFQEIMTKYSEKYSKLYDEGFFEKQLEFQIARQEFQEDVELEVAQLFIDHKEEIIGAMEAIMKILDFIGNFMNGISNHQSVSDIINNVNNSAKNVNVDTTFNIQGEVTNETINKIGLLNTDLYKNMINQI